MTVKAFVTLAIDVGKILGCRRVPLTNYKDGPFAKFLQFALAQADVNLNETTMRGFIKKALPLIPPMPRPQVKN